jgi:hypothetical protein
MVAGCLAAPPAAGDDGDLSAIDGGTGEFEPLCPAISLVSHWTFEGDLATSVADAISGNDGSIASSPPRPVPGRFGQAGEFRTSPAGFVVVPDDSSLDLAIGSIEIWALFHATTHVVICARDAMFNPDVDGDGHFRIRYDDDGFLRVRLQHADGEVMLVSHGPIAVDEWTHIVVSWGVEGGSGPMAQLYVGADLDDERESPFNWGDAMNPLVFGTDQDNAAPGAGTGTPSQYLDGIIDEIVLCSEPVSI